MRPSSFTKTLLAVAALSALSLSLALCLRSAQERQPHWTYNDPQQWGNLDPEYSACSLGRTQSPIDIQNARPARLPVLKINYQRVPLNIIDNGHTIQVNYPVGSTLSIGGNVYSLKQFHFHHPAEEEIEGQRFPLVAHFVHVDAESHLVVIAVLFEPGAANPALDTLWQNIPASKDREELLPSVAIQAADLFPPERGYFTFAGSLTTPPCAEGVTWYVLRDHPTVSEQQIAAFAKIYPMNARPIQPANGRRILQSK